MKMRAAVLEEVNKIVVKDIPTPRCDPRSILIKVNSCAICGTDVRIFSYGQKNVEMPFIIGHEVAGIVAEIGKEIKKNSKDLKEGERVVIFPAISCGECDFCQRGLYNLCSYKQSVGYTIPGGFAEFLLLPGFAIRNLIRIPEKVSFDEASLTEPLACCINGQRFLEISPGDTVVVIGAGPIGCMHSQLAKCYGATKIILIDLLESKLNLARDIDPQLIFVNSSKENPVRRVLEETTGRGAEKVIVACSSGRAQQEALEMASKGGRVLFFAGLPENNSFVNLNSNLIHYKELSIFGSFASMFWENKLALNLIESGQVKAKEMISHTFPLSQIVEGINLVKEGKALKVVITP